MRKNKVDFIARLLISACLLLAGTLWFSGAAPGMYFFLDPASLLVVILGTTAVTLMGFSLPQIGAACRQALRSADGPGVGGPERSIYFWEAAARNFFQVGVLMTVINFVIMMRGVPRGLTNPWRALAVCFVTTLYGLIFAALCAIAGLRAGRKIDGAEAQRQEMPERARQRERRWNPEWFVGFFLFLAAFGWVVVENEVLIMLIHWPSFLIVAGGAILFMLAAGSGRNGLSATLGFAITGAIGILFGFVQMFHGAPAIERISEGMTFAVLSCLFALAGMMLAGAHRQDRAFMAGENEGKMILSRGAWYGFPTAALLLLLYIFVLMLIPIVQKN